MNTYSPKITAQIGVLACAILLLVSGCATGISRVDPNGPRTLDSMNKLTMKDWNEASENLIKKMQEEFIGQGKLQSSGPQGKSVMVISRFVNQTAEQIEPDMLVKPIRGALNQTGKVLTDVTSGLGVAEDPIADAWKRQQIFESGGKISAPDYSLTVKIIGDKTRDGNTTEVSYTFLLSLATMDGLAVWEGEHRIVKQKTRGVIRP